MKEKIRILILGVGGNVSQGIIKALKNSDVNAELIGACVSEDAVGLYMCDKAYIAPYANDNKFLPWLIELCNNENVDIVLTGVEENIYAIMEQIELFNNKTKALFIASDFDKLKIGQDKYLTCEWLERNSCNFPKYCRLEELKEVEKLIEKVGFPLVAKPCVGKSSRGVYLVKNRTELDKIIQTEKEPYVLQECVGNNETEYTVGCYCDKNGVFINAIIMRRRVKDGSTFWAEVVDNDVIYEEVKKICNAFKPKGPLNVQLRLSEQGQPVCFELNVRFSGTTPIRTHYGYKDVEAMIKEYVLNEDIKNCFNITKGQVYRYVDEFYVDAVDKEIF